MRSRRRAGLIFKLHINVLAKWLCFVIRAKVKRAAEERRAARRTVYVREGYTEGQI
jgi:hypothetical protein